MFLRINSMLLLLLTDTWCAFWCIRCSRAVHSTWRKGAHIVLRLRGLYEACRLVCSSSMLARVRYCHEGLSTD